MMQGISHRPAGRIDGPKAFQAAFAVSRETLDRLTIYANLLSRWQKTINLVAPSTLSDVWHRHFADSAQLLEHAPTGAAHVLDVGSGAGFPGLVLAIMAAEHGGTRHTLVESDTRKAAFLREVARETRVAVEILAQRIELPETAAKVGEVNCVTARALAPLPRLIPLLAPYFGANTVGLFLKGRDVAAELEEARRGWDLECQLLPSVTDAEARIVKLSGLRQKR
ncbi:MAG: 16S rRNA (guanine(527)-N(7))-methyltransferase RsmG [Hyphomicrobium sp.]